MSQRDTPSSGESLIEQQISETLMGAQKAITEYIKKKQYYSLKDIPPQHQPELEELKSDADGAVMTAFEVLENYARDEMDDDWMETKVGTFNEMPVIFGSSIDDDGGDDVYYLDELRAKTIEWEETRHVRFEGEVTEQHSAPALMDSIRDYSKTWKLLFETMKRAEFAPQAPMPEYRAGESEEEILTHE